MCDDVQVWERAFLGVDVMIPIWINCYKYCNCVWVILGCKSCLVEGLLGVIFCMWMGIPIAVPIDPKTLSRENVEANCLSLVGHVTSDEKYECVMWKESMICSRMALGSVYYVSLRGSF